MSLTGDMLISSVRYTNGRPNGTRKHRLDTLAAMPRTPHGRSRVPLLRLRSLDETTDLFRASRVRAAVPAGDQPVFDVALSAGYRVRLTRAQRLYTPDGWVPLERLLGGIEAGGSGLTCGREPRALVGVNGYPVAATAVVLPHGRVAYRDGPWLEARIREGRPFAAIGALAGVSAHTVRTWTRKLGLAGLARRLKLTARPGNKGRRYRTRPKTPEERLAISLRMRGPRNHRWRGGLTHLPRALRAHILQRDRYRCQLCAAAPRGRRLHVHHIDPFAAGKASNHDPANLITLCTSCHGMVTGHEAAWAERLFHLIGAPARPVISVTRPSQAGVRVKFVAVVGVYAGGLEAAYDLVMDGPDRSFVANGVVVHSG
jgi:5-methylcytosine-specific restriction endonuclease McrA